MWAWWSKPKIDNTDHFATEKEYSRLCKEILNSDAELSLWDFNELKHTMNVDIYNDDKIITFLWWDVTPEDYKHEAYKFKSNLSANYWYTLDRIKSGNFENLNDSTVLVKLETGNIDFYDEIFVEWTTRKSLDKVFFAIENQDDRDHFIEFMNKNMKTFLLNYMKNTLAKEPEENAEIFTKKLLPMLKLIAAWPNHDKKSCIVELNYTFETHDIPTVITYTPDESHLSQYKLKMDTWVTDAQSQKYHNWIKTVTVRAEIDKDWNLIGIETNWVKNKRNQLLD